MISKLFADPRRFALKTLIIVWALALSAGLASAATTVGTDINTAGNLTVTGTSHMGPDESTLPAFLQGYVSSDNVLVTGDGTGKGYNTAFGVEAYNTTTAGYFSLVGFPDLSSGPAQGLGVDVYGNHAGQDVDGVYTSIGTLDFAAGQGIGFYVNPPYLGQTSAGSFTSTIAFYSADFAGSSVNPYYSWFDSRGVRRVKEDSSIDGVGQAIEALYNNQFTKYTPGAHDYERLVLGEWNASNVAEIGTENGGTGSARALAFLTASTTRMTIGADGSVGIGVTNSTVPLQVATPSTNATSTVIIGKTGQNKGSCLELFELCRDARLRLRGGRSVDVHLVGGKL